MTSDIPTPYDLAYAVVMKRAACPIVTAEDIMDGQHWLDDLSDAECWRLAVAADRIAATAVITITFPGEGEI